MADVPMLMLELQRALREMREQPILSLAVNRAQLPGDTPLRTLGEVSPELRPYLLAFGASSEAPGPRQGGLPVTGRRPALCLVRGGSESEPRAPRLGPSDGSSGAALLRATPSKSRWNPARGLPSADGGNPA